MRLTVDIDSKELLPRLRASLGFMFFGPAEIRETKRGYHYIWHDIKIDPKNPDSRMELAICYEHANQFDEAIKHYRGVISIFPGYSRAYVNLGYLFERYKKRDDLAIVCYEEAFQLNPQDEWALNNIGAILQKQGKWEESLDWYSRAYDANKKSSHIT